MPPLTWSEQLFQRLNPRATARLSRAVFESLEDRRLLSGTVATWTGAAGTGMWNTAGNWQNGVVPSAGQDVSFAGTATTQTIDLQTPVTVGSLTLGGAVLTGSGITLQGDVTADPTQRSAILTPITLAANVTATTEYDLILGGVIDDDGNGYGITFTGTGEVDMGGYVDTSGTVALPFDASPLACTYTGATTIDGNIVYLNDSLISSIQAENNGYLVGGPSIGGFAGTDAEIDPYNTGASVPSSITIAGGFSLDSNSNFGSSITSDTVYPRAVVTAGTINLGNATLYDQSPSDAYVPAGSVLTLIQNQTGQPVTGTFNGLAEGATVTLAGVTYTISYAGGSSGHDVTLTAIKVQSHINAGSLNLTANAGQTVALTAGVVGTDLNGDSPTGTVQFFDGTTLIGTGTLTAGLTTFHTAALSVGTHTINAVYSGDVNFAGTDAVNDQTTFVETINPAVVSTPSIAFTYATDPVTTSTRFATLSVLATDTTSTGEAGLTYRWTVLTSPTGAKAPLMPGNGTNAAKNMTMRLYKDGGYFFRVTATDAQGHSATRTVRLTVKQTAEDMRLTPHGARIARGSKLQFSGVLLDQFEHPMRSTYRLSWKLDKGQGSITSSGLFSSKKIAEHVTIEADWSDITGTVNATVV